jgi:hypothetical protein
MSVAKRCASRWRAAKAAVLDAEQHVEVLGHVHLRAGGHDRGGRGGRGRGGPGWRPGGMGWVPDGGGGGTGP